MKKKCDLTKAPLKKIGGALLIMYNNLDIKCKKCPAIKKLCDVDNHENSCNLAKCINFDVCGNTVKQVLICIFKKQ